MSKYVILAVAWIMGVFALAAFNVFLILPILAPEQGTTRNTINIVLGLVTGFIWYFVVRYIIFEKLAEREYRRRY